MMDRENISLFVLIGFPCLLIFITPCFSVAGSLLSQGGQLKYGELLHSDSDTFKLGFFSPDYGYSFYLGIWYSLDDQKNPKPVWIANRNNPIFNETGILSINSNGSLEIKYGKGHINTIPLYMVENATKTIATLQEDGNFVLRKNGNSSSGGSVLWQSFDYPTNTLLPEMKLGFNAQTGQSWSLTSWRSNNLPAMGSFTLGIDPNNTRQLIIWWRGQVFWRSGEWQEKYSSFELSPMLSVSYEYDNPGSYGFHAFHPYDRRHLVHYNFHYNSTKDEVYFSYSVNKTQLYLGPAEQVPILAITSEGGFRKGLFSTNTLSCNPDSDSPDSGCVTERLPECRIFYDHFIDVLSGIMSSEGFKFEESQNMTVSDCEYECKKNCACIAFASTNELYETGCEIWSNGSTFNATTSPSKKDRTIHILQSPFQPSYYYDNERRSKSMWWISLIVLGGLFIVVPLLCYLCYLIWTKCKIEVDKIVKQTMLVREIGGRTVASIIYDITKRHRKEEKTNDEMHIFSFKRVASATKNFSAENKLGEGGFGPVYKGKMHDGQEVAIKRLSKRSRQGLVEFKNEAKLIAKLQHTNLVRLLGFCVQREERTLIYEYLPNKSLDFYIFDLEKRNMLNWTKRFTIIEGIAQRLAYLHFYSRLIVIHRDLKASNILLDNDMNPKISDFGMARIFELKGIEENTSRIVGTYYMSPEYAMNDIVSIKTDVFSFGVLLLEIVSGKKNNSRYHSEYPLNLIGLAWQLWNEGRGTEIIDTSLLESCATDEVLRCIQIGLLCVQDRASDRPNILEVVSMLSNETALLPSPKQPAFYFDTVEEEEPNGLEEPKTCSINEVTISIMDGRS